MFHYLSITLSAVLSGDSCDMSLLIKLKLSPHVSLKCKLYRLNKLLQLLLIEERLMLMILRHARGVGRLSDRVSFGGSIKQSSAGTELQ